MVHLANVKILYDLCDRPQMGTTLRLFIIKNKIEREKTLSTKYTSIMDVKNHVGEEVTIGAWVANKSGKGKIAFLQLRDGNFFKEKNFLGKILISSNT